MTATTTPEPDDNDAVQEAEEIIRIEAESANMEAIFKQLAMLGVCLNRWRALMMEDGKYSEDWTEEAAMHVFNRFYPPFVPEFRIGHDDDDD